MRLKAVGTAARGCLGGESGAVVTKLLAVLVVVLFAALIFALIETLCPFTLALHTVILSQRHTETYVAPSRNPLFRPWRRTLWCTAHKVRSVITMRPIAEHDGASFLQRLSAMSVQAQHSSESEPFTFDLADVIVTHRRRTRENTGRILPTCFCVSASRR